jgi:methyl-accepting chemotaxis protein-1 (serine sensor receptor)
MKNWKISTRLTGAFALLVAMLLTLAVTSLMQLSSLRNETVNITSNWLPSVEAVNESPRF